MRTIILLLFLIVTSYIEAQPGPLYFPPVVYNYTILDASGVAIKFRNNPEYKICIDDEWFHSDSIPLVPEPIKMGPEDSLVLQKFQLEGLSTILYSQPNSVIFIYVNDFYLKLTHAITLIKIAHGKDTMSLFQQSETPMELRFSPGYHYFPYWATHAQKGLPQLTGSQYKKIDQHHFVISKADYDSLQYDSLQINSYERKNANITRIENEIADKYLKGFVNVEHNFIPLEFMQDVSPYEGGYFDSQLYPTQEENVYMGMMDYHMREHNCTSSKDFFTRIDLNQNKIEHWFPLNNPQKFGSHSRYFLVDTFNQVTYLKVVFRIDTISPLKECASWAKYQNAMYKSYNYGKNWKEDKKFTKLFNEYAFYSYEFLDKDYALGYKIQKIKHPIKKNQIDQGVYYLIKNGEIIETFLTPEDVPFNTNDANYHFSKGYGDTVFIGSWGYNPYNHKESNVHQLYAVKQNSKWIFEIGTTGFKRSPHYKVQKIKTDYQNFKIIGDTLLFNNGAKMVSRVQIVENPLERGMLILEQGDHIYLVNTVSQVMYISFDAGASWLFYPKKLEQTGDMMFLRIDPDYNISFFNRREFSQKTYRIIPVK